VKEMTNDTLPKWMSFFEKIVSSNKSGWAVGNSYSLADLALYNALTNLVNRFPAALDKSPSLRALVDRVGSRPGVAKWVKERPKSEW